MPDLNKHLISIIVPVYNSEKTIHSCVESLQAQTVKNIEILLVDDGSKDNSLALCNKLAQTDSRITVLHKENGGQSSARNLGLDSAAGSYIAFVDSDDTIDSDMLELLLANALETSSQMSVCGVRLMKNGVDVSPKRHSDERVVFTKEDAIIQMLDEKYILFSVCDKLYHRNLLEQLRFEVGVIHEDILFPYEALLLCENVVCEMKPKYNYLLNEGSTTRKEFSPARLYDITAREKLVADVLKRYPQLFENTENTILVGYLNLINKLVYDNSDVRQKYLAPLLRSVRKNAGSYLNSKYINKKKKLGVLLICLGSPFYKMALSVIGGGNR